MSGLILQLLMATAAAVGAIVVALFPDEAAFTVVIGAMLLCTLLGLVVTLQSGGLRRSRGWREVVWHGPLVTVWSNWFKPIPLSSAAQALLVAAAAALGAIGRLLWLAYA